MSEPLAAGSQAPDFTLPAGDGQKITLSELRGQKVVLTFYPADFSPGCQNQMEAYTRETTEFEARDGKVFGISVDNTWSHKAC